MKKIIIFLLGIMLAICLIGCGAGGGESADESTTSSSSEESASLSTEEPDEELRFQQDYYVLEQYESVQLVVEEFIGQSVTYKSMDETIAKIDDKGFLNALSEGRTTIKAESEGKSATCNVVVKKSDYVPILEVEHDYVYIDTVTEYTMAVVANHKGSAISDAIDYTVTLADGADGSIADVSVTKDEIKIKGLKPGEADYYVSATVRGKYLNKKFTVKVVSLGYSIKTEMEGVSVSEEGYSTSVMSYKASDADVTEMLLDFDVYKGREKVDNATINWVSRNEDVLTVENRNGAPYIVAQKGGVATVVGTYAEGNNTATATLICTVEKPIVSLVLDEKPSISVNGAIANPNENKLTIPSEKLIGDFYRVTFDGKTASVASDNADGKINVTLKGDVFPTKTELLGANTIIIETDLLQYELPVDIYTLVIRNQQDLQSVAAIADSLNGGGYYVLGGNVTLTADWYNVSNNYSIGLSALKPFVGIIDGKGYSISGLNTNGNWSKIGFITRMGDGGILRNIAFLNTRFQGQGTVVSYATGGLIENVYVKVRERWVNQKSSGAFGVYDGQQNLTLKNVVVDYDGTNFLTGGNYGGMLLGSYADASKLENVVVLGVTDEWKDNVAINGDNVYAAYVSGGDNGVAFPTEWDSTYWTIDETNKTVEWKKK